jgi:hypothetical protein
MNKKLKKIIKALERAFDEACAYNTDQELIDELAEALELARSLKVKKS